MSDLTLNLYKFVFIDCFFWPRNCKHQVVKIKAISCFKVYRITVITRRRSGRSMSGVSRTPAFPWCLPRSIHEVTYRKNGLIPKVLSPSFLNLTARVQRTGPLHSSAYIPNIDRTTRASSLKFSWNILCEN